MASGSTMCDSLTGGKGTYKCLCKKHYCHLAWTAHMLKLLWDSVGIGADWALECFFRHAMRHCGIVQLKLVELRLRPCAMINGWMLGPGQRFCFDHCQYTGSMPKRTGRYIVFS